MALETGNYIASLVATNPPGTDPKNQGDDHLRLIKTALLNCFPGFTGSIMVTGTDGGAANAYTVTPTPALLAYSTRMIVAFSPTVQNTGATTLNISGLGVKDVKSVSGAALVSGDLTVGTIYAAYYNGSEFRLLSITKNYADQLAFGTALPSQTGNSDKVITTDGTTATWTDLLKVGTMKLADSSDTTKRGQFNLSAVSAGATRTLKMPDKNIILGGAVDYSARTSNSILVGADIDTLIDVTSGTFTQTFTAAATLGSGWFCYYRNNQTSGEITLDPDGGELIDGLTSYIMYPGETRLVVCTGTDFRTVVLSAFEKTFTSTGTFTKPPGYRAFEGEVWNGGNSGRKSTGLGNEAGGGGGGMCFPFNIASSFFGATETITIGAGAIGPSSAGNGTVGGVSSIGTLVVPATPTTGFAAGQSFTNASVTFTGTPIYLEGQGNGSGGTSGLIIYGGSGANNAAAAGNSMWGGAAGGTVSSANVVFAPGTSKFGGNGGAASSASSGSNGATPGGGGGGTQTGAKAGDGGGGQVRIRGCV